MTLPFFSTLRTSRKLERGVTFTGISEESVINESKAWLDRHGQFGDVFQVYEVTTRPVAQVACDKPAPPPPEPKAGRHAFKKGKAPLRCDVCNCIEEEHV